MGRALITLALLLTGTIVGARALAQSDALNSTRIARIDSAVRSQVGR